MIYFITPYNQKFSFLPIRIRTTVFLCSEFNKFIRRACVFKFQEVFGAILSVSAHTSTPNTRVYKSLFVVFIQSSTDSYMRRLREFSFANQKVFMRTLLELFFRRPSKNSCFDKLKMIVTNKIIIKFNQLPSYI